MVCPPRPWGSIFWAVWGAFIFAYLSVFIRILYRIQTAAIFYFRPHLPDRKAWKSATILTRSKRKLLSIIYGPHPNNNRWEAQHLGVFHSNTSTVFIWHKMVIMSVLWRALSTCWRSRFPELILQTLNSAMSTSYNRFSSVKCYQYLLKDTSHNNSWFFTKPLSTG